MPKRPKHKRLESRGRAGASSRARQRPRDPRSAAGELREVRKAQAETAEELGNVSVPMATEPAFAFQP
jgi:hypothetical protein